MHKQQLELTTCYCWDTGGKGTLPAQRTNFNTLDNWGHKTPTQSKRRKDRKEKIKGPWPGTHTIHSVTIVLFFFQDYAIKAEIIWSYYHLSSEDKKKEKKKERKV